MLMAAVMTVTVAADEPASSADKIGKMTVVYLRDGGTGDGSDYANAVGTLADAYMMLDLSQDCTIVICDKFTFAGAARFNYGEKYTGKVTLTSCYGGYDYRTIGAKFEFDPFRFYCWGETAFEYMDFYTTGNNILVVGQHNPVTIGEEVKITGSEKMTGGTVATSFCIVGGYQKARNEYEPAPPYEDNADTNITVMSGEFIYIVPFARETGSNTYRGTAHIKIGGNAKVSVLHGSAIGTNAMVGNFDVEITDNAYIKVFYGSTNAGVIANNYTFNWKSGTVDKFFWECPYTATASELSVEGTTVLNASDAIKASAVYLSIATAFDTIGSVAQDPAYVPADNPNTAKPGNDILKAPTTTKTPDPSEIVVDPDQGGSVDTDPAGGDENTTKPEKETKPVFTRAPRDEESTDAPGQSSGGDNTEGGDNTLIIIIAAVSAVAVIGAVVAVLLIKKKKA